jgi:HlyD family secretion protein
MLPTQRTPFAVSLIAVAVLLTGTWGLFGSNSQAADAPAGAASAPKAGASAPKPSMTVTTAQPQRASVPVKLSANGSIAAWQEASIGSESSGLKLSSVRVNVGDVVKAGQVLATFAPETIQADVAQARAALMEAEANASEAAANAERARTLQTSGALSAQQISQFLTAEQTAKARVEAARATLNVQQLRLKHTQVVAPDSGIVSARSATVGAVVGGGTELFRLIRQGRLEWRAEVPSSDLGRLKTGTPVVVTLPGGETTPGKVRMVAPTVDPQTRAALVYVGLDAKSAARQGMFAKGEFELGASEALTVPQQALVMRDGFSYLFKVGPENKVSQVKVEAGRRIGERVEITRGIDAGATVAVSGAGFLNDGDTVRVANGAVANGAVAK